MPQTPSRRPPPAPKGRPGPLGPDSGLSSGRRALEGRAAWPGGRLTPGGPPPPPPPPPPPLGYRLVTPTLNFPGSDDAQTRGPESWSVNYDAIPLVNGCDQLQACFVNAHMSGGQSEAGDGAAASYAVTYEYPAGSGVFFPASWGGAPEATAASGALTAWHDPVQIPTLASAPPGALLGVCTSWRGVGYLGSYSRRAGARSAKLIGESGSPPSLSTANRSSWTTGGDLLMPVLIKGLMAGPSVAEVYLGDSITVDQAHSADAFGVAGFAREVEGDRGVVKLCATSDSLAAQAASFSIRAAVIARIPDARTQVHVNLGANDLAGGSALALTSALSSLVATLKAAGAGVRVYPMTLSPRVDAGSVTGAAVRAGYNAAIRAGVPGADGFYDFGDWAEAPNARDSQSWGAVSGSAKDVDGVHPRWGDPTVRGDLLSYRRAWRATALV